MFAHHVFGVMWAVTWPRTRLAISYRPLTTVVWNSARPTLLIGQPSQVRPSNCHAGTVVSNLAAVAWGVIFGVVTLGVASTCAIAGGSGAETFCAAPVIVEPSSARTQARSGRE